MFTRMDNAIEECDECLTIGNFHLFCLYINDHVGISIKEYDIEQQINGKYIILHKVEGQVCKTD